VSAQRLEIKGRGRDNPNGLPGLEDFDTLAGESIPAENILALPHTSLYALDYPTQQAVFVETPPETDLSRAPFYYISQFEHALRLFTVPIETLHRLASDLTFDSSRLILIYSVGRSGSTLLSSAFAEVDGVVGLSEPDFYTQLVAFRQWDGSYDGPIRQLLQTCTRVLCKTPAGSPSPQGWALKLRSFGIELSDLFLAEFPDAKLIFLYRNAGTWTQSAARAFLDENYESPEYIANSIAWLRPVVSRVDRDLVTWDEIPTIGHVATLMWLSVMERWLALQAAGKPTLSIRFEDLIAQPEAAIQVVFDFCGLTDVNYRQVFKVLAQDSQAGTNLSRESLQAKKVILPENFLAEIQARLSAQPIINTPDFCVPGTWQPD
jgi:hypothetical protein